MNENIKKLFEHNFLDGDKIDDCGKATFSADRALEIAQFFFEEGRNQTIQECIEALPKENLEDNDRHYNMALRNCRETLQALIKE